MPMMPRDILEIQSAIDRYEKKFPHKPSPTPAEALAWKAGSAFIPTRGAGSESRECEVCSSVHEHGPSSPTRALVGFPLWTYADHARPNLKQQLTS